MDSVEDGFPAAPHCVTTGSDEVREKTLNGKVAKASVKIAKGDVIEITFGTNNVKVQVEDIKDTTKKEDAKDLFKYL